MPGDEHEELSEEAIKARIREMNKGDKILFDDRKQPLTVTKVYRSRVDIEGPQGGEYSLSSRDAKLHYKRLADDTDGIIRYGRQYLDYVRIVEKAD